jgi:uncharacterized protein
MSRIDGPDDAVDVHIHVVEPELPGSKGAIGDAGLDPLTLPIDQLAATLAHQMREARIKTVLGMGRINGPADDALGINGTLRIASLLPKPLTLRAIGAADPRWTLAENPQHFKVAERQIAVGEVVALKAYLGYIPVGPDHPGYLPYYALAAKYKIPVIFHTGDTWSTAAKVRCAHPLLVDDVAVDHPDVRFVLAHFGNPWLADAAEVIYKNENVWADLSAIIVGSDKDFATDDHGRPHPDSSWAAAEGDVRKAYHYAGKPDRFLFGTDWTLAPFVGYRKFIASIVPPSDHAKVFRENALALFGLK